jgi:PIN domain nuclease of toxin-antitoxin system
MTGAVLLDTCAIIFFMRSQRISKAAMAAVESASTAQSILISAISAWEVGLIERKAPGSFTPDAKSWFAQMLTHPGATLTPLTPEIAVNSSHLPGTLHNDPADRLLIATARALGVPIVTRDAKILGYGRAGHVKTIAC